MVAVVLPASIRAEELQLRVWQVQDAPALAEAVAASVEHLRPFLPWISQEPLSDDERRALLARWHEAYSAGGDATYAVLREGRVVGAIGAHGADPPTRPLAPDAREIGYWLRPDEVGRGTMTRAVRALTEALLAAPGISHVEIRMDVANIRSAAIPPRCGYRLVGTELRTATAPAETGRGLVWRIGPDPA